MLKQWLTAGVVVLSAGCATLPTNYRSLENRTPVTLGEILTQAEHAGVVFVGEAHTNREDHLVQFEMIRHLHEQGKRVAVGLEMFPANAQPVLDAWVYGGMSAWDFEGYYYQFWSVPYSHYAAIFDYARTEGIPLVGINASKALVRRVAAAGSDAVPEDERRRIQFTACSGESGIGPTSMVSRSKIPHEMRLPHLCEAQRFRDATMAFHIARCLRAGAEVVVVLTGAAHAAKEGVPAMLKYHAEVPTAVLVPADFRALTGRALDTRIADYTWY